MLKLLTHPGGWILAVVVLTLALRGAAGQVNGAGAAPLAPLAGGAPVQVLEPPHDKAALIPLYGEVDEVMRKSIERRVDIARKAGCTLIVFQVNTYGGLLTSALDICKIIKRLPEEHINTVAWIDDKAISAGALVATACQKIVITQVTDFGDCAPIQVSGDEIVPVPVTERAKFNSPVVKEFDDSAARNGYSKTLLEAMVVPTEIDEVRDNLTGETRYVDAAEKDKLLKEESVVPGGGKDRPWRFVQTIDTADQLLTLANGNDAVKMGLAKAVVDTQPQLEAAMNIRGQLMVLDFNWEELATRWFSQTWVRTMLFIAMLVLAWIEFSHPGTTVPGILSVVCLVLLVGAPYLTGLAQAWEIILIVLGLGVIATDFFVFGGIGLLAVPGFLLMAIGLVASFVPAEPGGHWIPTMPGTWSALQTGLMVVVFGSLAALGTFVFLSRYLYMTPGFRRLQLAPVGAAIASPEAIVRDSADRSAQEAVFVGAIGRAATLLRPAGKGRFGEHLVDVVSFGTFIPQGAEIEVVEMEGNRVVVRLRKVQPGQTADPGGQA